METLLATKHINFHQKFLAVWILITTVFLSIVVFSIWDQLRSQIQHQFDIHAHRLAFKLDELIENVFESVDSIAIYPDEGNACEKIIPHLRSVVFNNANIAGIVVSDLKNKALCATSEGKVPPLELDSKSPVLIGPIKINHRLHDVFLLQKRWAQYYIGVYLLKETFYNLLHNNSDKLEFAGLYDNQKNTMVFQIGAVSLKKTLLLKNSASSPLGEHTAILPLHSLDNIQLVISTHSSDFIKQLITRLLLLVLPLLMLSWLLYSYCRRIINKRFSPEHVLTIALNEGQFYPVYQPIRDESNQCFCGAEVLIRWKTDFNETIMPDYFINEAEKTGLIVPITLQLIEIAFQECLVLFQSSKRFYLSLNLSPTHFADELFFPKFYNLCTEYNISPHQLMLELTERELFNQSDANIIGRMKELRARGFSLAIDDFGTGQANINYLQHLLFNYLKIDKIFIKTIGTGAIIETLNSSIINMANSLGLKIIAEGVETQEQRDYLWEKNVIFFQGWFFAQAMPFEQLVQLINHPKDVE